MIDSTVVGFRSGLGERSGCVLRARFSRPFVDSSLNSGGEVSTAKEARGTNLKTAFRFSTQDGAPVLVKVGLSAVSIEGARENLRAELNHWDFERVRTDADRIWNKELAKIVVTGGNENHLKNFYTALTTQCWRLIYSWMWIVNIAAAISRLSSQRLRQLHSLLLVGHVRPRTRSAQSSISDARETSSTLSWRNTNKEAGFPFGNWLGMKPIR